MKHLTKIFVGLAIVLFIVGYYLQATDHDSQGIKLFYNTYIPFIVKVIFYIK